MDGVGHGLVKPESPAMPHPQALPNFENAFIPEAKIVGYALNPDHDVGRHKARVFSSVLGITQDNASVLYSAIHAGLKSAPSVKKHADKHGQRYEVDIPVTGPAGSAMVRTGWIVQKEGSVPQLTSAYVKDAK
jgi:hypothetical protein